MQHWQSLQPDEQDILLRLLSLFQAGEESVALDLLPLILVLAREGRLEEELFLTAFLWEEAKHVEVFRRFLDCIGQQGTDLTVYHTPSYRRIFYEALPDSMARLLSDAGPSAVARASVTYNLIVEGVLAETGYHAFYQVLERRNAMPGLLETVGKLKQDESRHIAFGVYLLSRLTAEYGEPVWQAIEQQMNLLLEPALGVVTEAFAPYDPVPFDLRLDDFVDFALKQFRSRYARIERARSQSVEAIMLDEAGFAEMGEA